MPTKVPNSGYVEKVYINTSLSKEELYSLFDSLTFVEVESDGKMYYMLASVTDSQEIFIAVQKADTSYVFMVQGTNYMFGFDESMGGWFNAISENIPNVVEINGEVMASMETISIGAENDKITNLFSTTPFEEPIALKPFLEGIADAIRVKKKTTELINAQDFRNEILSIKGGLIEVTELPEVGEEDVVYKLVSKSTQVPNSGYVEKVYFNTALGVEEVDNILSNIEYITYAGVTRYGVIAFGDNYGIYINNYSADNVYHITYGQLGNPDSVVEIYTSRNGWADFTSYEINAETFTETFASQLGQKMQNDKLINLISTTPFSGEFDYYIYDKVFKPFPNKGTISEIYFNTSLSVEEVVAELSKLTLSEDGIYVLGGSFETPCLLYITYHETAGWTIQDVFKSNIFFTSTYWDSINSAGWNYNLIKDGKYTFAEPIKLLTYNDDGDIVGAENPKITNVVRIFEPTWKQISGGIKKVSELPVKGNSNYVYKIQSGNAELYMSMDGELINFADVAQAQGIPVSIEIVDKLPTENINASSETTAMYLYYIIGDTIYAYMDFGDGNLSWVNFIEITSGGLLTKPSGEYNSVDEIQIEEGIGFYTILPSSGDYYIYEGGKPTQVPNSGWIENLYFNTKLSVEEVDNILSQLTYDEDGYAYVVGAYEKGSGYGNIIIVEANAFTEGQIPSGYIIGHMNDITNMASTDFIYMSNQGLVDLALTMGINTKVGWNMETLNLNQTFNGAFGTENDKLINVISTTLYPRWTKISGGGATVKATPIAVPNTGYVERVYFNKSLSFDEVNAIVEKANSFVANELVPIYCVVSNDTFDKQLSTFKLTDHDGTTFNSIHYPTLGNVIWSERDYYNEEKDGSITQFKKGWMFEEDYVEINGEVVSFIEGDFAVNVGQHNDKLTELFSANGTFVSEMKLDGEYDGTTIFLSNKIASEPTVVPNSGTVKKVYFNTDLSEEKIVNLIGQFNMFYLIATNDFSNFIALLYDEEGIIIANEATGEYYFNTKGTDYADFTGWNPNFNGVIEINKEVIAEYNGLPIGTENDKLINLISTTPFEAKTVNNFNIDIKSMLEEKKLPMSINVNVEPNLQEKEVTENGEYVADEGYDGFSKVTVNVASSGEDMLQARVDATNSCQNLFYEYSGDTVDYIKDLDTSKVTNMYRMFMYCSKIQTIPPLNTSKVTDMGSMFASCSALTEIPQLDTSNVTNMSSMFASCSNLITIPPIDLIKVVSAYDLVQYCYKLTNLTLLNIKSNLQISNGSSWGHLLTLESLINTVKELVNAGISRTLTMGSANLNKIASTYVKFTNSSVTTIPAYEKGDVVVCESTDEGAMLLKDYALLKNWTLA